MRQKAALFWAIALALVLTTLAGCSSSGNEAGPKDQNVAQEAPKAPSDIPDDEPAAQIASQVSPSVVQVNVQAVQVTPFGTEKGKGIGSGVIYRRDGYIITNNHVVQDTDQVNVAFQDGSQEQGEVVGKDQSTDLAVIKVDRGDLPAAKFSEGKNLVPGQLAIAIGSPSGFQSTVTQGIISGLNRDIPAELVGNPKEAQSLVDLIQTDAPISPGNSGGALVDRSGEVVGINVAYLPPQQTGAESIGFAIPSDTATSVADQLIQNGRVSNPYIGISYQDLRPEIAQQYGLSVEEGVIIIDVVSGGPADSAGLRREDVITALDSTTVSSSGDLLKALRSYKPGDTVTLTVVRGGTSSEEQVKVKLGEREQ